MNQIGDRLREELGLLREEMREQRRLTGVLMSALKFAISWVEATQGEKVTEQGFKEFLDEVRRIEGR